MAGQGSVAHEFADVVSVPRDTAIFWQPQTNERGTRNRINEYLGFDPERIHPVTQELGAARMFFVKANDTYPNGVQPHLPRDPRADTEMVIR